MAPMNAPTLLSALSRSSVRLSSHSTSALLRPTILHASTRPFSTKRPLKAPNAVYVAVRDPDTLQTLILSSASSRRPLITLWTASWCSTCRQVLPLIQELIEQEKVGEAEGGVGLVEVEYDAPGNEEGGMRYMINSVPTLLAFSRGEAQLNTKVYKKAELSDREFLRKWIETEARRGGEGGAGGQGILGKLFGTNKTETP